MASIPAADLRTPVSGTTGKRKREDDEDAILVNGDHEPKQSGNDSEAQIQVISHIFDILKSYDPSSTIVDFDLSLITNRDEPAAKRTKTARNDDRKTIARNVAAEVYVTIADFATDVDKVMSHLMHTNAHRFNEVNGERPQIPAVDESDNLKATISAVKTKFHSIVEREKKRASRQHGATSIDEVALRQSSEPLVNGFIKDELNPQIKSEDADEGSKLVLTLYGSASGHKQLFSSLQKPALTVGKGDSDKSSLRDLDVHFSIGESGLPAGLGVSKVLSAQESEISSDMHRSPSTFKEVFGPRTRLAELTPPRPSRVNGNGWQRRKPAYYTTSQRGYSGEKMIAGQWLGYAGIAPAQEPVTPQVRRIIRDRALSMGETQMTTPEEPEDGLKPAEEDALFRSAYSSFAPTRDNSAAVFPDHMKSAVWWERTGKHYFDRVFAIDPALQAIGDPLAEESSAFIEEELDDEELKQAVNEYTPEDDFQMATKAAPVASGDQDMEEMLKEVAELLETLYSYQRLRLSSINSSSRPGSRPGTGHGTGNGIPLHRYNGTPTMPSTAEVETYNTLKAQLSLMISILPPYAVARLNGEMLEDLNVSQRISVEVPDTRGVLEEEQVKREAKAAAMSSANMLAANQVRSYNTTQGQYAAASRPIAPVTQPSRANFSGRAMYNGTYTPNGSAFSRQPLSSWQTPSHQTPQSYQVNYQRGGYANQTPGFSQQSPRANSINTFRTPLGQYNNLQRPGSNHSQVNGIHQTPPPGSYQTRPPSAGTGSPGRQATMYAPPGQQQQMPGVGSGMFNLQQPNNHQRQQQYTTAGQQPPLGQQLANQQASSASPQPQQTPQAAPVANMGTGNSEVSHAGVNGVNLTAQPVLDAQPMASDEQDALAEPIKEVVMDDAVATDLPAAKSTPEQIDQPSVDITTTSEESITAHPIDTKGAVDNSKVDGAGAEAAAVDVHMTNGVNGDDAATPTAAADPVAENGEASAPN